MIHGESPEHAYARARGERARSISELVEGSGEEDGTPDEEEPGSEEDEEDDGEDSKSLRLC